MKPLWKSGESSEARQARRLAKKKSKAHFVVHYDLAYDGGGSAWKGYYRTYTGARIAALWNLHVTSWGGSAEVFAYPYPVPPPTKGPRRGRK